MVCRAVRTLKAETSLRGQNETKENENVYEFPARWQRQTPVKVFGVSKLVKWIFRVHGKHRRMVLNILGRLTAH